MLLDRWIENLIFEQSDTLWGAVVNNMTRFINDHGGAAKLDKREFH